MSNNNCTFTDAQLKAIWDSIQKNDVAGLQSGLNDSGFHGDRAERARDTMKTLAGQATDYNTFVGMVQGELQVRTKLSVQEVGALAPAGAKWQGNGGRTWEGSASVAGPTPTTTKGPAVKG